MPFDIFKTYKRAHFNIYESQEEFKTEEYYEIFKQNPET